MVARKFILAVLVLLAGQGVRAQKRVTRVEQVWVAYLNQTRLSGKWGFQADVQLRTAEDFFSRYSLSAVRAGATFFINDRTTVTAGYAYFHYYPGENHKYVAQPEHRAWQQLQWVNNTPRFRLNHRVRLEERFRRKIESDSNLGRGHNFNYRARFNMLVMLPLSKKGFAPQTLSVVAANEVMVNFGRQIVYNTFDQNRISAGLAYQFGLQGSVQAVYMNIFQQLSAGNQYRSTHYGRVTYLHNLDWRKQPNPKST